MEKKTNCVTTSGSAWGARAALETVALDPAERSITVRVPFSVRRRGGRKLIAADVELATTISHPPEADTSLVTALARAYRWKTLLDEGKIGSMRELANAEAIDHAYLSRALRLTLLAPDIIDSILNGAHRRNINLYALSLLSKHLLWEDQRRMFATKGTTSDGVDVA